MSQKMINKYIIETNIDGYVNGFHDTLDDQYDFIGQMSDYQDVLFSIPEGWYKFEDGEFILDQERKNTILAEREAEAAKPTWQDIAEAQFMYTAMMTDTLLDVYEEE